MLHPSHPAVTAGASRSVTLPGHKKVVGPMTVIETLIGLGKTAAPATALAAMFTARPRKRHALPAWAAQVKTKR
jgi:hypothetical protein